MANLKMALSQADMNKWGSRLAAEDWTWVTWKYLLGETALFALWLIFMYTLVSMVVPSLKRQLVYTTGLPVNGSVLFSAFIITWLIATLTHGAIFGAGPYGYWLQSWLGENSFNDLANWTHQYLTLFGVLFTLGSL
jgi:hypothetical protein